MSRSLPAILLFCLVFSYARAADYTELAPRFASEVRKKMEELKPGDSTPGDCASREARVASDLAYGRYENIKDFHAACGDRSLSAATWLALAQAFQAVFDWNSATLAFENSIRLNKDPGSLFAFAAFLWQQDRIDRAKQVLALEASWNPVVALATVEKISQKTTDLAGDRQIEEFLAGWISSDRSPKMREQAVLMRAQLHTLTYQHLASLNHLQTNFSALADPSKYFKTAFLNFYAGAAPELRHAGLFYRAKLPYVHRYSPLPIEQNVYNYSQLYLKVCREALLDANELAKLNEKKDEWLQGRLPTGDFLAFLQDMNRRLPDKADLLSHLGGLLEVTGDDETAFTFLWRSHQLCPYYNRAHRGIGNLNLRKRNKSFPGYDELLAKVDEALAGREFDPSLQNYVLNWGSLPDEARKRVKYSLLFWRPYIKWLHDGGNRTFIKYSFQLLSESPGLAEIRDQRIDYENDGRLWDDVRGLGGKTVIAEYDEVMEVPFGAYGLLTHEVAHQFHGALPAAAAGCIANLYQEAKLNGRFPDAYAARNELEYFAQGATYWMIPEESPKRFGTNRGWILRNDPRLANFLAQIDEGKSVTDLTCPVQQALPFIEETRTPIPRWIPSIFRPEFR